MSIGFNLDSVLYELQGVDFPAHKWRRLANSLRVASVVDNIDADHRDVAGKLQAVVSHWIGNTTQHNQWTTLVEAASMCDERRRAKKLAAIVGVEYTPAQARIPGIDSTLTHYKHACVHYEHHSVNNSIYCVN